MKIAIIGTGNLGKSIAKGLITNNAITSLYLTKRNLDGIADFERRRRERGRRRKRKGKRRKGDGDPDGGAALGGKR